MVEVISGEKRESDSVTQLLLTLKAMAAHTGKHVSMYGVVIDKAFSQARLVKYHEHGCYSDGTFHPSILEDVCNILIKTRP